MSTAEAIEQEIPRKTSKKPLMLGGVLAIVLGAGGFYAVQTGMILGPPEIVAEPTEQEIKALPDVGFVEVDPLIISLGHEAERRHLRFRAQLEVAQGYEADVKAMLPRVTDILNGYLRAVEVAELEDPAALIRLRAQMLRRIQIVTGEGRVRDLLVMEFVLN
jgi:flagellar FliL protein